MSLRDPAERAFSHWAPKYSLGFESLSFDDAMAHNFERLQAGRGLDGPDLQRLWCASLDRRNRNAAFVSYIDAGFYAAHLMRFFALFPRERFCILTLDELVHHPEQVAQRLFRFAGLDPARGPGEAPHNHARSGTGPRLLHRIGHALNVPRLLPPAWRKRVRAWTSRFQRQLAPPPETMRRLRDFYAPHNQALCELLGWSRCPW